MIFEQRLIGNSRSGLAQFAEVQGMRNAYNHNEAGFAAMNASLGLHVNEGLIPTEVYQEFDKDAVEIMTGDNGEVILADLLPQSKSVAIGKLVSKYRKTSDAGNPQTSMSGQLGVKMDRTDNIYDGALIPIHDAGFSRNWREYSAQTSEGFDALIDDNRETNISLRAHIVDNFLDGHNDADGNAITIDGISWGGMKNDARVEQVNLGASGINFDFTDVTKSYAEIEAAFKLVRNVMFITNNCDQELTYYVSRQIASNFERNSNESASTENKVLQRLASLMGVKEIKSTAKLVGNEIMAFPTTGGMVRPLVGMGVNTIAMPRPLYNSGYEFTVWAAIGFQVKTDYNGSTCAMFAQDLG